MCLATDLPTRGTISSVGEGVADDVADDVGVDEDTVSTWGMPRGARDEELVKVVPEEGEGARGCVYS